MCVEKWQLTREGGPETGFFSLVTNEQRPAHPRTTIDAATHTHTVLLSHTFYAFSSFILFLYFFETRYMNYADRKCVFSGKPVFEKENLF